MKNLNSWLSKLTLALMLISANISANAQHSPNYCSNYFSSANASEGYLNLGLGYSIINQYNGKFDNYYYKITDQSVTSVSTNNLSEWIPLHDFSSSIYSSYIYLNKYLAPGNYKVWAFNNSCDAKAPFSRNLTVNCGSYYASLPNLHIQHENDGKIDIVWDASYNTQPLTVQYSVYNSQNQSANTWTTVTTNFFNSKILNINKDQYNLPLTQGKNYEVAVRYLIACSGSYSYTAYADFTIDHCPQTVQNIIVTDNFNGSVNVNWDAVTPTPAEGYAYSISHQYGSPIYPTDYTFTTQTALANIDTMFNGINFQDNQGYIIRVKSVCQQDTAHSQIQQKSFTVNTCNNTIHNVQLTQNTDNTMTLVWADSSAITPFNYQYAINKIGTSSSLIPTNSTSISNITQPGNGNAFENNVKYVATIFKSCTSTTFATVSMTDTLEFNVCQIAPTNLAVTQNAGALNINFTGNAPTDGYLYAITPMNTTVLNAYYKPTTTTSLTNITRSTNNDQLLNHNQQYLISVKSACSLALNYVSTSTTATITINNCAAAPTNLVINTSTDYADISWTEPTNVPVDGYSIYVGYNSNALANYPSNFEDVIDTNGYRHYDYSDYYYVFVVSRCGASHSTAITGNFSLANCDDNRPEHIEIETGMNGVSATWEYSSNTLPADGFRYVISTSYNTPNYELGTIVNGMSLNNVNTTYDGQPLIEGGYYYLHVFGVCDSVNGYYNNNYIHNYEHEFFYRKCHAPEIDFIINPDSTISAIWYSSNTLVDHYSYAIRNSNGPNALYPINFTTTTTTSLSNIATTFDNQIFIPGNYYHIEMYSVCDATNNVKSQISYSDYIDFEGQNCSTVGYYLDTYYNNDALSIELQTYGNSPAQGFVYAIIPSNGSVNNYTFKPFVPTLTNGNSITMEGITHTTFNNALFFPNTQYKVIVKSVCDSLLFNYGQDKYDYFVANNQPAECQYINDLQLVDNHNKSININWNTNGISTHGYEFAVLPIATTLQASHYVATSSAPVYNVFTTTTGDSLVHGQAYAVYVRSKCGANQYSQKVGKSITLHSTLSALDLENSTTFNVYPNPVSSTLTIELPVATTENSVVTISDLTGKIISTTTLTEAVSEVNVEELVKGVYLVSVASKSVQKTVRIVKQ